jgi:predicted Zn-dependent peptidase
MCAEHHARHYNAANSVLVFSGNVNPDEALELATKHFSAMPKGTRVETTAPVHQQKRPRYELVDNVSSQTELRVCFRAVPDKLRHRATMDMMLRLLDDGMSTRLYHRVVDDKGLCYDVSASYDGYDDDGILDFAAGVQHARAATVATEITGLVRDLAAAGPNAEELEKARRRHRWDMRAMMDSPEELAGFYAAGILFDRRESIEERLESNAAVSSQDIRDLAGLIATPDRLNVVAVGPTEDLEDSTLESVVTSYQV